MNDDDDDRKFRVIGTIRKGSMIRYWQPNGFPEGIIEVNPEHPPRIHYFDGRPTQEIKESDHEQ